MYRIKPKRALPRDAICSDHKGISRMAEELSSIGKRNLGKLGMIDNEVSKDV